MRKLFVSLATIGFAVALATGVNAATINAVANAAATNFTAGAIPSDNVFETDSASGSGPQTFVSAAATASNDGDLGSGTSTSFASANSVTGELKASTAGSLSLAPDVQGGPGVSGLATAEITETFLLNGTGSLTLSMLFDVTWNQPVGGFQAIASVRLGPVNSDFVSFGPIDGISGSVDDVALAVTANFTNAVDLSVDGFWDILVMRGDQPGFVNASNTGTIWFETSGSLVATPSSDTFLSDPAYPDDLANTVPNPIPLPASVLLLGLGIAGLRPMLRRDA